MTSLRLSLFYGGYFGAVGVILPFWPLWLAGRGIGPDEIGLVVGAGLLARVVSGPVAAHVTDRGGDVRKLIVTLAVGSLLVFTLFPLTTGLWSVVGLWLLFGCFWSPIMSLGESVTLANVRTRNVDYGRVRLWGSVTFIAVSATSGRLLSGNEPALIHALILGLVAATVVVCLLLPRTASEARPPGKLPLGQVLGDRRFLAMLAAGALLQCSHAVYYAFGSIHWAAAGHSEAVIGWLWAEGVIAETLLFMVSRRFVDKLGPGGMFALAGLAGVVRWPVLALTTDLTALVAVQALHAFTFGAAHLAAIAFIRQQLPPTLSATGISVYSSGVNGISMGVFMLLSGHLYAGYEGHAYFAMAAMCALGCGVGLLMARRERTAAARPG
jgi:PPP family 3-phenylpropionic acid transporter